MPVSRPAIFHVPDALKSPINPGDFHGGIKPCAQHLDAHTRCHVLGLTVLCMKSAETGNIFGRSVLGFLQGPREPLRVRSSPHSYDLKSHIPRANSLVAGELRLDVNSPYHTTR